MKKLICLLLAALFLFSLAACGQQAAQPTQEPTPAPVEPTPTQDGPTSLIPDDNADGKTLVVYFSATGSTEKVAQTIADHLDADTFALEPVTPYTSDDLNWRNEDSRVCQEHDDPARQTVELTATTPENWEDYDTVFVGYPIWWQNASWVVTTFVAANDFEGKTVIPFCTSASSSLGESDKNLAAATDGGNWLEGERFRSSVSADDVVEWVDSLELN